MICSLCGNGYGDPKDLSRDSWCGPCESDRVALGQAFLEETGSTWLYDKGEFVLRKVRELLDAREHLG